MSTPLGWRKSARSGHTGCVELAATAIRDSRNPGPTLHFTPTHLATFITTVKADALNHARS